MYAYARGYARDVAQRGMDITVARCRCFVGISIQLSKQYANLGFGNV